MNDTPDSSEDEIDGVAKFLASNYELFTVLGVFGALTVYLSRISTGEHYAVYGIAGASLLFFVTGLTLVVRIYQEMFKEKAVSSLGAFVRRIGYLSLFYGLFAVIFELSVLVALSYPKGAGNLLEMLIIALLFTLYLPGISYIWQLEREGKAWKWVKVSPVLSFILVTFTVVFSHFWGDPIPIAYENPAKELGAVFGLIVVHILLTVIIAFLPGLFITLKKVHRRISSI